jgi:hypothetical protein
VPLRHLRSCCCSAPIPGGSGGSAAGGRLRTVGSWNPKICLTGTSGAWLRVWVRLTEPGCCRSCGPTHAARMVCFVGRTR